MTFSKLNRLIVFLIISVLGANVHSVYASNGQESFPFYIGGGLGYTVYPNVKSFYVDPGDEGYKLEDDTFGYNAVLGWEFLEGYLAAELIYSDFGKMEHTDTLIEGSLTYIDVYNGQLLSKGIAVRGAFPITSRFAIYGKLGYSEWEWKEKYKYSTYENDEFDPERSSSGEDSLDDKDFFYSLGFDFNYKPNVVIYGEYTYQYAELDFGNKSFDWFDASSLSVGVRWKFGPSSLTWRSGTNKRASDESRGLTACDDEFKDSVGGVICESEE